MRHHSQISNPPLQLLISWSLVATAVCSHHRVGLPMPQLPRFGWTWLTDWRLVDTESQVLYRTRLKHLLP